MQMQYVYVTVEHHALIVTAIQLLQVELSSITTW